MSWATLGTVLIIVSIAFLAAGAVDGLLEEGIWSSVRSYVRRLRTRLLHWLAHARATLWSYAQRSWAKVWPGHKEAPSRVKTGEGFSASFSDAPGSATLVYGDIVARVADIEVSVHGLQDRVTAMEQDYPQAIDDGLVRERRETLGRGRRSFKYIIAGIALEIAAVVVSRL